MQSELEIWADVKGFEGIYMASNLGRVKVLGRIRYGGKNSSKSYHPEKFLKLTPLKNKYLCITLAKDRKMHSALVHRVICETFHPNPLGLECVNHKDGNRQNNRADNLEWCTRSYNMRHAYEMKRNRILNQAA